MAVETQIPKITDAVLLEALSAAQKKQKLTQQQGELLEFVDVEHRGVALLARPMVVDLSTFLANPKNAFPSFGVPPKHNAAAPDFGGSAIGGMEAGRLEKDTASGNPAVPAPENAHVFGVMPAVHAMGSWASGMSTESGTQGGADLIYPKNWGQSIVLGFDSGWYVCAILRNVGESFPHAPAPTVAYRKYRSQEAALQSAYDYAVTGSLKKGVRAEPPPELVAAHEAAKGVTETYHAFLSAKQTDSEPMGANTAFFAAREKGAPPASKPIWYA